MSQFFCFFIVDLRGAESAADGSEQEAPMDTSSVYTEESDTDHREPTVQLQPQVGQFK